MPDHWMEHVSAFVCPVGHPTPLHGQYRRADGLFVVSVFCLARMAAAAPLVEVVATFQDESNECVSQPCEVAEACVAKGIAFALSKQTVANNTNPGDCVAWEFFGAVANPPCVSADAADGEAVVSFAHEGKYQVQARIVGPSGNTVSESEVFGVEIRDVPESSFEVEPQGPLCWEQEICFRAPWVGFGDVRAWDFGDGGSAIAGNGHTSDSCHFFAEPGVYEISLATTSLCGQTSDTRQVTIEDCFSCKTCACPEGWYDKNRQSCVVGVGCPVSGMPDGDKGGGFFAWRGTLFRDVPGAECNVSEADFVWGPWLERDRPSGSGDFETFSDFLAMEEVCAKPLGIQCQTRDGVPWSQTGEVYRCELSVGGICRNADNEDSAGCSDYRVRFCC